MKKRLLLHAALCLFMAGAFITVHAQEDSMKSLPPVVIYSKSNVDKAVTEAFNRQFKDAMDPQWYKMNKNFLVTFIEGDMKNNALFKANGRLIYNVKYGNETNLPEDIKKQIHDAYADYNITRAVNVLINDRNVWVVNLEGLKKWLVVRSENGELEEVENYNKG